jgi:hypothetical protein
MRVLLVGTLILALLAIAIGALWCCALDSDDERHWQEW